MANKIYTIGREFGSGGREVGEKLAAKLGIKLYDKELLQQAAKDSGFCEEIFENHDEKPTNSFLYSLVMDTYSVSGYSAAPFLIMLYLITLIVSMFSFMQTWMYVSKMSAGT